MSVAKYVRGDIQQAIHADLSDGKYTIHDVETWHWALVRIAQGCWPEVSTDSRLELLRRPVPYSMPGFEWQQKPGRRYRFLAWLGRLLKKPGWLDQTRVLVAIPEVEWLGTGQAVVVERTIDLVRVHSLSIPGVRALGYDRELDTLFIDRAKPAMWQQPCANL